MTRHTPIGERLRGSRIDDLGSTHISVSPETRRVERDDHPGPRLTAAPLRTQATMR